MTIGAKEAVAAMRQSHDKLAQFAAEADGEMLRTLSGSSEWNVADVLSHLGSAAELGRNTLVSGQADPGAAPAVWARWDALTPEDKATAFISASEALVEAYEALDDDELVDKKIDVGFLPAPVDVNYVAIMRLGEMALHGWDIDVAFNPAAAVSDHLVPYVLVQLPRFAGFFAKGIGRTGVVAVTLDDLALAYTLELREDGVHLTEGPAGAAGTRVSMPGEAFVLLTAGRLGPAHTPLDVTVEGELSLDDLRQLFPGY